MSLAEQGIFDWGEFQQRLIESVAEAQRDDPQNPSRGYYESWLAALERLLEENQLLGEAIDAPDGAHPQRADVV